MTLVDRDNFAAVAWSAVYCFLLVLIAGVFNALEIQPAVTVPVVVLVLPVVLGLLSARLERKLLGKTNG